MFGKRRFYLPGSPAYIVQRDHSLEPVFFENYDYIAYLDRLGEAAERYGCAIHAYALMTNQIHLLATTKKQNSISLVMQYIGRFYVSYINQTYGSGGTIWEGCYKASMIHVGEFLLTCMRSRAQSRQGGYGQDTRRLSLEQLPGEWARRSQ